MKVLIIPDSFKGCLTSVEVCDAISNGLKSYNNNIDIKSMPFSDGGEGFCEYLGDITKAKKHTISCHDIYNIEKQCSYYTFDDSAIIDTASASGIQNRKNIMYASSIGTGELIRNAYDNGYKKIIIGIGGTGCCDGGIGALNQLGVKFYDELFNIIENPKAIDMNSVFGISYKNRIKDIDFTFACDVDNKYFGANGAAYVFAPQKGARKTDVEELDNGLQRINAFFKNDISNVKGCGAGGGICGGIFAVFGGKIESGFDILCRYTNLEEKIKNADLVITGEGKTDNQTLMGKLPYKICKLTEKHNKKCIVISGNITDDVKLGYKMISLVDKNTSEEYAINNAKELLTQKAQSILQDIL